MAVLVGQSDRPAYPCVVGKIARQRRRRDALADIGLDQHMRFAVGLAGAVDRADIERGMAPGRLRQIFDDAGDPAVAFDQQHVAGLDDLVQLLGIARRERLIARHLLLEVIGDQLADPVEHDPHDTVPKPPELPAYSDDRCKPLPFGSLHGRDSVFA